MSDSAKHPVEEILQLCAGSAPKPWYPRVFARETGIPREDLDPHLDRLRIAGLIQLTPWEVDVHQGYELTPAGRELLQNPKQMARLRDGHLPPRQEAAPYHASDPADREGTTWNRGEAVREVFLGSARPTVTLVLIWLNILFFAYGLVLAYQAQIPLGDYLSGKPNDILRQTGAADGVDVFFKHQWWRLLTCCFVHIGLVHLGVNMYSLYVTGPMVERMWGRSGYLALYLLAGFGGSCGLLIGNPVSGGAGASGALCGIMASIAVWAYLNRGVLAAETLAMMRRQLIMVVFLNILITYNIHGISNGAHLGGAIVGLLVSFPLDHLRFGNGAKRGLALASLLAIPLISTAFMIRALEQNKELERWGQVLARREARNLRQGELDNFNEHFQTINGALRAAGEMSELKVQPLLNQHPNRRDPEAVQAALAALEKRQLELATLAQQLNNVSPYRDADLEALRGVGQSYLEQMAAYFLLADDCLKQGEAWTPAREKQREESFGKLIEIDKQWADLIRRFRNE